MIAARRAGCPSGGVAQARNADFPGRLAQPRNGVLPVTLPAAARGKGRENGRSRNTKRSITSAPAPARNPAMITKDLVLHAVGTLRGLSQRLTC
jgi:hypothetical protein